MTSLAIRLLALDNHELEEFIEQWVETKSAAYHLVERLGAANDKGRDVVAFHTKEKHDGPWDLYQCKRKAHGSKLGLGEAIGELGKLFYHHVEGAYSTLPKAYVFVSPRGIVGSAQDLIRNPSQLGKFLIAHWDEYCAKSIKQKASLPLTSKIRSAIEQFDFSTVGYLSATLIVKDPHAQPALSKVLNLLPGEAPQGTAPANIQSIELIYIHQLVEIYGEEAGTPFKNAEDVFGHPTHGDHLRLQRTRFFDAAHFKRFHRDNTAPGAVETFQQDVYHGIVDVYTEAHKSRLVRVNQVMKHAATIPLALLGRLARVPVRQGMCHHLANEGGLKWSS